MSPRRLVAIGDQSSSLQPQVWAALAEEFRVDCISWQELDLLRLHEFEAHAIVVTIERAEEHLNRFLDCLRERPLGIPTLAFIAQGAGQETLRNAAKVIDDFAFFPAQPCEVLCRLHRMLGPAVSDPSELDGIQARLSTEYGLTQIVTQNAAFQKIIETIPRIAASNVSVLITGETGVGKELCARAIHHLSARATDPFIPMDCAALPESLMENEMFGHAKGAYTGATMEQKGLVALAERGTLFLDEVDSLSLASQAKLLRLLQAHTFRPLGGERFCHSDARVIAATNGNLDALLKTGKLRADLYYRLDILHLHIPPLRDRRNDIALLTKRAIDSLAEENPTARKRLSPAALHKLESHDWPGNVRELFNVVQRAAILSTSQEIGPWDIVLGPERIAQPAREKPKSFRSERAQAIERFERAYVAEMLERHHGNITRAAMEAGKDRRAFGRLVGKYHVSHETDLKRGRINPLPGQN